MSRIYFHSPSGDREIYGRERPWMGCLTDDVAAGVFRMIDPDAVAKLMPPGAFPLKELEDRLGCHPRFRESFRLWCRADSDRHFIVAGERYNVWEVALNTCLAIGGDPLKLCARLHAQCEIHCYAEGPNRAWLAGIIRAGIACGLMRDGGYGPPSDYGGGQWAALASWLESRDDEPVVCSYSVCDQFPNRFVAEWEDDRGGDGWYDLPGDERWSLAMAKLRESGPELTPEGWSDYRFGHGKDALWLMDRATGKGVSDA